MLRARRAYVRNGGDRDPAVIAAIDVVRWELSLGTRVAAPARRESSQSVLAKLVLS
jgi:hypothetical protein